MPYSVRKFLSIFALTTLSLSVPALAAPAGLDQAVAEYNSRHYAEALFRLQNINRSNPSDAMTHYYMGLSYQALNQIQSAQGEYNWIYAYSKDQRLRYNAYQALQQIQRWSANRAYQGQGNNFARVQGSPYRPAPAAARDAAGSGVPS